MAGLDLIAIRIAIAETVVAGTQRAIHGYPYPKGGTEELPAVVVHPSTDGYVDPWGSLGDGAMCIVQFTLELMAPCRVTFEDGLRVLDEMMSAGVGLPASVIDALEADRTLNGTVEDSLLGVSTGHTGMFMVDGTQAVICRWPLTVYKSRS